MIHPIYLWERRGSRALVVMGYLETGMRVLDLPHAFPDEELAVLGANDTNTTADHEAINLEAVRLRTSLTD